MSGGAVRPVAGQSRPKAARPTRHVWVYEDEVGIKVEFGTTTQAIPRLKSDDLKVLVHCNTPLDCPYGDADLFYSAQLLHYGMLPVGSAKGAIDVFKKEFARPCNREEGLKIPATVLALEDALECEYEERMRKKEARLVQLQEELDAVEAMKQKEVQLRLELQALQTTPAVSGEESGHQMDDHKETSSEDEPLCQSKAWQMHLSRLKRQNRSRRSRIFDDEEEDEEIAEAEDDLWPTRGKRMRVQQ